MDWSLRVQCPNICLDGGIICAALMSKPYGFKYFGNETRGNMLREVLVLSHKNSYGLSHARPKDITLYQRLTVNKL